MPGLMLSLYLRLGHTHSPLTVQVKMEGLVLPFPLLMPGVMLRTHLILENLSFCIQLSVQRLMSVITVIDKPPAITIAVAVVRVLIVVTIRPLSGVLATHVRGAR